MLRTFLYFGLIGFLAIALGWIADRPGEVSLSWLGYHVHASVLVALLLLCLLATLAFMAIALVRSLWHLPFGFSSWRRESRQRRGRKALSAGMIALAAGDGVRARIALKHVLECLPHDPLAMLFQAQMAQVDGDVARASRLFHRMVHEPQTRLLGLRGLHLEAHRRGDHEEAHQHAKLALADAANAAHLRWAHESVFNSVVREGHYAEALRMVKAQVRARTMDRARGARLQGVLLMAQAMGLAENHAETALRLARAALRYAPDLVPAACLAATLEKQRGKVARASDVIKRTYQRNPHPELVALFLGLRRGDSAKDRLARAKLLARLSPFHKESALAVAGAALEAREFAEARQTLAPFLVPGQEDKVSVRMCLIMAHLEELDFARDGRHGGAQSTPPDAALGFSGSNTVSLDMTREWYARAAYAPRDEAWMCDGKIYDHWAPFSPKTGALDAFEWCAPPSGGHGKIAPAASSIIHAHSAPAYIAPPQDTPAQLAAPASSAQEPDASDTFGRESPDADVSAKPNPDPAPKAKKPLLAWLGVERAPKRAAEAQNESQHHTDSGNGPGKHRIDSAEAAAQGQNPEVNQNAPGVPAPDLAAANTLLAHSGLAKAPVHKGVQGNFALPAAQVSAPPSAPPSVPPSVPPRTPLKQHHDGAAAVAIPVPPDVPKDKTADAASSGVGMFPAFLKNPLLRPRARLNEPLAMLPDDPGTGGAGNAPMR